MVKVAWISQEVDLYFFEAHIDTLREAGHRVREISWVNPLTGKRDPDRAFQKTSGSNIVIVMFTHLEKGKAKSFIKEWHKRKIKVIVLEYYPEGSDEFLGLPLTLDEIKNAVSKLSRNR